jgi:hypothetical protein
MDRRIRKELSKITYQMDLLLLGMKMDRWKVKKETKNPNIN